MSLFGEVVQAQQAQANEPRLNADMRLKMQEFLASKTAHEQDMQQRAQELQMRHQEYQLDSAQKQKALEYENQKFMQGQQQQAQQFGTAHQFDVAQEGRTAKDFEQKQKDVQSQRDALSKYMSSMGGQQPQQGGAAPAYGPQKPGLGPNVSLVPPNTPPNMGAQTRQDIMQELAQKSGGDPVAFKSLVDMSEARMALADKMQFAQEENKLKGPNTMSGQVGQLAQLYQKPISEGGKGLPPDEAIRKAVEDYKSSGSSGTAEGKLDVKLEERMPKSESMIKDMRASTENLTQFFTQARNLAGGLTTGFGANLAGIKGTPAYDLARVVDTIKSNVGFDKLQKMRDESPTGSALGRVTNFEMQTLQNVVASLDPGQSTEQFLQHLAIAEKEINASMQRVQDAYNDTYKGVKGFSAFEAAPASSGGLSKMSDDEIKKALGL